MFPPKLHPGDEVRICSPSRSLAIISPDVRKIAEQRLKQLGLRVTYSKHAEERDQFDSSSIKSRVDDLHAAFKDKKVKAILTPIGGFNCNQLLKYLDYNLIKANPKILCGYSDITALSNAIYAKTGLITYSGPHFSTLGMKQGCEYILDYFHKCFLQKKPIIVTPSPEWSDDEWYLNQEKRRFEKNDGYWILNAGNAEGTIIGGNLCTLNLLHGTEFMPSLKNAILFLEDDYESPPHTFDRDLQSLLHLPEFKGVKGIVIGRFQKRSAMTKEKMQQIIQTKVELKNIPVVSNADFGHTTPLITFPVGGRARLSVTGDRAQLTILKH